MCPKAGHLAETLKEIDRCMTTLGFKGMTLEPSLGMQPLTYADDPILYPV